MPNRDIRLPAFLTLKDRQTAIIASPGMTLGGQLLLADLAVGGTSQEELASAFLASIRVPLLKQLQGPVEGNRSHPGLLFFRN